MKWTVYDKTGNVKRCDIHKLEYNGAFMGESYVSADITSPYPINFEIGDYFIYRNEQFTINYDPTVIKKSRNCANGESYKYESVKFNSYSDELTRCDFLDYVKYDELIHYSSLPSFSFYAASIKDLAERIQVNLDRIYTEDNKWTVEVHPEYVNTSNVYIEVDKIKVWKALELIKSKFDANFVIRGRKITIGTAGVVIDNVFQYGKDKGLFEIQRSAQSDQQLVTRLRVYGSTRNLPNRYYSTLIDPIVEAPILDVTYSYGLFTTVLFKFDFKVNMISETAVIEINGKKYRISEVQDTQGQGQKFSFMTGTKEEAESIISGAIARFDDDGIDKKNIPSKYKRASGKVVPNNMAVFNLMLPGFPDETLDPYIDSKYIEDIGIREDSIFFDGSDEKLKEIFPSMEDMTAQQLIDAGVPCSVDEDDNGSLDEIAADAINEDGSEIEDDGIWENMVENSDETPTFSVRLKDIGFDINDYISSESPVLSMKNGMCGGREFEIIRCLKVGNKYIVVCERQFDESLKLYFPYKGYNIKAGDKFVLLNIEMPDVYVKAASQKLLSAGKEYLSKNEYVRYSYSLKVDEIFVARRPELSDKLKEGNLMLFTDSDIHVDGSIIISSIRIVEGEQIIPTYEITLSNETTVGTIEKIQNAIDSISSGGQGSGGYNSQQIRSLVKSFGSLFFLRKDQPDTAKELITFLKGLVSQSVDSQSIVSHGEITAGGSVTAGKGVQFGQSYASGLTGHGGQIDSLGRGELESLILRRFLEVPELRYNRVRVTAGDLWLSPGGGLIESVEPDTDIEGNALNTGVITLKLESGEIGTVAVDDLCMGMYHFESGNATEDYDDGIGNRRMSGFSTSYFRITEILETGTNSKFRYKLRDKSDNYPTPVTPASMMHFACYGNVSNKQRQSSIYLNGSGDPYIRMLKEVDWWEFSFKNIACQFGYLDNLKIFGVDMTGYSAFINSLYFTGKIEQLDQIIEDTLGTGDLRMEIDSSEGTLFVDNNIDTTLTAKVLRYFKDLTGDVTGWKWTRESGTRQVDIASDAIWNEANSSARESVHVTAGDIPTDSVKFVCEATVGKAKVTEEFRINN